LPEILCAEQLTAKDDEPVLLLPALSEDQYAASATTPDRREDRLAATTLLHGGARHELLKKTGTGMAGVAVPGWRRGRTGG
jgi:hypothetical protein